MNQILGVYSEEFQLQVTTASGASLIKVTFAIVDEPAFRATVIRAFGQLGLKHLQGPPPAGFCESGLGYWLSALKEA